MSVAVDDVPRCRSRNLQSSMKRKKPGVVSVTPGLAAPARAKTPVTSAIAKTWTDSPNSHQVSSEIPPNHLEYRNQPTSQRRDSKTRRADSAIALLEMQRPAVVRRSDSLR